MFGKIDVRTLIGSISWFLTVKHTKEYPKTSRQTIERKLAVDMIHTPRIQKKKTEAHFTAMFYDILRLNLNKHTILTGFDAIVIRLVCVK